MSCQAIWPAGSGSMRGGHRDRTATVCQAGNLYALQAWRDSGMCDFHSTMSAPHSCPPPFALHPAPARLLPAHPAPLAFFPCSSKPLLRC